MARDGIAYPDHERLWAAIDAIAAMHGLTPSALARRAGLNASSFNRSKRIGLKGRPRWPSTQSIARVLAVTGVGLEAFLALMQRGVAGSANGSSVHGGAVPLVDPIHAVQPGFFEPGSAPVGAVWDSIAFPLPRDQAEFAIEVRDDSLLPLYCRGDIIIVSMLAEVRRGDRLCIRLVDGGMIARVFCRQTADSIELVEPGTPSRVTSIDLARVGWFARILWASQ